MWFYEMGSVVHCQHLHHNAAVTSAGSLAGCRLLAKALAMPPLLALVPTSLVEQRNAAFIRVVWHAVEQVCVRGAGGGVRLWWCGTCQGRMCCV